MGIKAVGTITEHLNERKRVEVDLGKAEPVQVLHHRGAIWCVEPGDWMNDTDGSAEP